MGGNQESYLTTENTVEETGSLRRFADIYFVVGFMRRRRKRFRVVPHYDTMN